MVAPSISAGVGVTVGLSTLFYSSTYCLHVVYTLCSKKSDAKIKITITTAHRIRINYPLISFNCCLSGTNVANFNKIHHMVSEQ